MYIPLGSGRSSCTAKRDRLSIASGDDSDACLLNVSPGGQWRVWRHADSRDSLTSRSRPRFCEVVVSRGPRLASEEENILLYESQRSSVKRETNRNDIENSRFFLPISSETS